MNPSPDRILALWRDKPAWAPDFQQIREALGLRRSDERQLGSRLETLLARGEIRKQGKVYQRQQEESARPAKGAPTSPRSGRSEPGGAGAEVIGMFSAHPNGFGFVEFTGEADSLFIPPPYIAGALDGDLVRAVRQREPGRKRTSGRILEVLERRHPRIRGRFQHERRQMWVAPLNEKLPLIFITEGEPPPWPDGTLVEAELTHYPRHHDEAPEGRIVQAFEQDADAPEQVVLHILSDLNLSPEFSAATHAEMARLRTPPLEPGAGRVDQRDLPYVTIDGEDARDFDDAVCLQELGEGRRRLFVAIADVAAYVLPGSAVDEDATRKGTSVYFPNQVFPMLPERLSNDLCSLRPDEPRLTLTCEMELDADGERTGYRIYESLIRSQKRLTYRRVQRLFDEGDAAELPSNLAEMLHAMRALAARLRERRGARGALDFSFPEYKFELDAKGWPRKVNEVWATESNRLIEQFMLEANETVAEHCAKARIPILYRVHDPPPPDQVQQLAVTLLNFGVEVKPAQLARPLALQTLLARVQQHPQRDQVEIAILRTLSQAQYRSRNDGHFALAAGFYTHFTSPIRRYPDLLLHRALKASLARPPRKFALPRDAGMRTSLSERTASEAEGRVVRLYKVLYMEPRLGQTFAATVRGVSERGLWLRLRDEPVDGLLPLDVMPNAPRYDRERNRLLTRGKGPGLGMGDEIRVVLARADRLTQQLEFAWVAHNWEDGKETAPATAPPRERSRVAAAKKPAPSGKKAARPRAKASRTPKEKRRSAGSRAGGAKRAKAPAPKPRGKRGAASAGKPRGTPRGKGKRR